jgi:ABC-type antimicrobial peptide transport system permease subunit
MGGLDLCRLRMPGVSPDPEVTFIDVGPSFFETMGIPVLSGRAFSAADVTQKRQLAIISEAFAKRYYPRQDAIGKPLQALVRSKPETYEIAGIVRDARLGSLRGESGPMMYLMASREVSALQVRTAGDADAVARAIGQEIRRVNPRMLLDIRTMRQAIDRSIEKERLVAATSAVFGLLVLLLVSIGIFGVTSYTVAQRTNELGIRMALGAGRGSVIHESLRDTMLVLGAGLAAGIAAAVVAVRPASSFIADLLFGLTATDMANIAGAVLLMLAVALAACILPAHRATRIDPLSAIRHEPPCRSSSEVASVEIERFGHNHRRGLLHQHQGGACRRISLSGAR